MKERQPYCRAQLEQLSQRNLGNLARKTLGNWPPQNNDHQFLAKTFSVSFCYSNRKSKCRHHLKNQIKKDRSKTKIQIKKKKILFTQQVMKWATLPCKKYHCCLRNNPV